MKQLTLIFTLIGLTLALATPAPALLIDPNYDAFEGEQLKVLKEAVKEWADFFTCSDGRTITVSFICDNNLYETTNLLGDANVLIVGGYPKDAIITLDNNDLYWNLADLPNWPAGHTNDYDALSLAKHEVGHAVGFFYGLNSKFTSGVKQDNDIWFYNLGGDPDKYDDDDFKLDPNEIHGHDHAADPNDLMYWEQDPYKRYHPTLKHAKVLSDAYGYDLVPEPTTVALFGLGGLALLRKRMV